MLELSILVPEAEVETVSDALMALDALSVSVEDADEGTDVEQARFGEPGMPLSEVAWIHSRIKSLFADEHAADHAQRVLLVQEFFAQCRIESLVQVPDQDWVRLTQSQFEPLAITPEFWIVPTWHDVPETAKLHIRLDPGLAFGTGTHPTTRMCLEWMASWSEHPQRALDYGCGSGILAIAAAKLGVGSVDAVDIDPSAIESTLANAKANGVEVQTGMPDRVSGTYPWVVANILASPLKVLAPLLCQLTQAQGHLVLAGILSRQVDEIAAAYAPWIALKVDRERDGWVLMTGQKSA
jgi:ribosomal protein L11 methyltransferase